MVQASIRFLKWNSQYLSEKPYELFLQPSEHAGIPRTNLTFENKDVLVQDIRGLEGSYSLDDQGFCYLQHATKSLSSLDRQSITSNYIPETEEMLKAALGDSTLVMCFDWKLRQSIDREEFAKKTIDLNDGLTRLLPALSAHVDQSPQAAQERAKKHVPATENLDELFKGRFRIINVWRPLHKVVSWPLLLCEAQSVSKDDLCACDIVRRQHIGETLFAKYNADHRWVYLSDQQPDEVVMMKIYDTSPAAKAKFCVHASAPIPKESLEVRESIEARFVVFSKQ